MPFSQRFLEASVSTAMVLTSRVARAIGVAGILLSAPIVMTACRRKERATAAAAAPSPRATDAARAHEAILRAYIEALDRHDVEAQFNLYAPEMLQPPEGQTIAAKKEKSRHEREFEAVNNARWSYAVTGAGLDTLEATITEAMDFYDALGAGPRSHRARYRFLDGKIADIETWDWTQPGRPYEGARDRFVAWLSKERPAQASRLLKDGRLVFSKQTAAEMTALAREWDAAISPPATR